ncbi:MAG: molybdenum cofactor biosynthesis protein MoaE [Myxococcales bacterium]|nr:molybdenum cofactor biosynthesis protein MoaE [Myxococcales bacterium]
MTATMRVRYFAAARELAGCGEEALPLEAESLDPHALRALLAARHPALAAHLDRMRLAVNGALDPREASVRAGDVVDVLPPVAGGAAVALCAIRSTPLSVDEALAAVRHRSAGGVALFIGVVRDHADGKAVSRLDYEAHPELAEPAMRRVLDETATAHPQARLAAVHRVGALEIGDAAVIVAASAPHREEAFAACRAAIDAIKETVPIWKKEWDERGEASWVNL